MKLLLILALIPQFAFGTCDFAKGIVPGPNKTFIYSEACHQEVGKLVQENKIQAQQVTDLTKAISLKDLSLQESDKRAQTWFDTSGTLEHRLQEVDKIEKIDSWLYFGLGVLATGATAYAASKLR